VKPTIGSLYAGIGGLDIGFEWAGFRPAWQVEIDEWKRSVLAEIVPGAERFGDVRDCGEHNLRRVDCITGGIPCQPFSTSGSRRGAADDRYLWPEMPRVVRALMPAFVLVENVAGLAHDSRHDQRGLQAHGAAGRD
jgi:DNA (cytosine-5)-methyltransferase 1